MSLIASFVRLDFYIVKPYRNQFLLYIALTIFMTFMHNDLSSIYTYLIMCLTLSNAYPFIAGDKDKLDTLYSTLSLCRSHVVIGRYVYMLCMGAVTMLTAVALTCFFVLFFDFQFALQGTLALSCVAYAFLFFTTALQYPIYFKMGYNKGRFVAIFPFFLTVGSAYFVYFLSENRIISRFLGNLPILVTSNPVLASFLAAAAGLLALAISCAISCKIYLKREI